MTDPTIRRTWTDEPTPAELRAVRAYLATGSVDDAAQLIGCSRATVLIHLAKLRRRAGVHTTAQAVFVFHDRIAA